MAQIPATAATVIMDFGKRIITDDMLYLDPEEPGDYGREKEPHVTIKFGLTQSYTQEQMQEMLRGTKPFSITVRGMDVFSNPKFDVIKFNVDGEELHRLRKVFDALPNVDEHPIYHPHMTLAYVKPGLGKPFQGKVTKSISRIPINLIKYSDRGKPLFFKL
jgi:2'-5' RNA ligase